MIMMNKVVKQLKRKSNLRSVAMPISSRNITLSQDEKVMEVNRKTVVCFNNLALKWPSSTSHKNLGCLPHQRLKSTRQPKRFATVSRNAYVRAVLKQSEPSLTIAKRRHWGTNNCYSKPSKISPLWTSKQLSLRPSFNSLRIKSVVGRKESCILSISLSRSKMRRKAR